MALAPNISDPGLEPHQESILQACRSGQLTELRALFQACNIQRGDQLVYLVRWPGDKPFDTISMFVAAIENSQLAIVEYLISIYPAIDLDHPTIAHAIITAKNLDILQTVVEQSPRICSLEFHYMSTFLTELCREGPDAAPLVDFLLDHDADPNAGGHVQFSVLGIAMKSGLSVDILRKILMKGAVCSVFMISHAIGIERVDALQLLLDLWRGELTASQEEQLHEALNRCANKQIIELTNEFMRENTIGYRTKIKSAFARVSGRLAQATMPTVLRSHKMGEKENL